MRMGFLGVGEWGRLTRLAATAALCEVDLRGTRMVYPPGTVALLLAIKHRFDCGLETVIRCPESADVRNYLERVDFFAKAARWANFDSDTSLLASNRRNTSARFTELLTPSDDGFASALRVLDLFLHRHVPARAIAAYSALDETLQNIEDHSAPGHDAAYSCVQIQVFDGAVELALGDLGVGIKASLVRNDTIRALRSDSDALRGVLLERLTRLVNNRARGGGLRRVSEIVSECSGEFRMQSRTGLARTREGEPGRMRFDTLTGEFPGTLVWIRIPKSNA